MTSFDKEVEDSKLNQYWSTAATNKVFVDEIQLHATRCAFLSTPSIYFALTDDSLKKNSCLFEFDRRWQDDSGFVFYDFNKPEAVPVDKFGAFDYIVVDPPFITKEVWSKYMATVKLIGTERCKLLFTSVLENHPMLENLLGGPLFIGRFQPSIPKLTYQYHCFTNYVTNHGLTQPNPEVPSPDPKTLAGIEMANGIRESEKDFHVIMQMRDRTGEVLLPAEGSDTALGSGDNGEGGLSSALAQDPAMKWKTIPKGLSELPAEGTAAAVECESQEYKDLAERRQRMDLFKREIDKAFLSLDAYSKQKTDEDRAKQLKIKNDAVEQMVELEKVVRAANDEDANGICKIMTDCITALKSKDVFVGEELKEMGADATRKYKSPIFNRMKELLAQMKLAKKKAAAEQSH